MTRISWKNIWKMQGLWIARLRVYALSLAGAFSIFETRIRVCTGAISLAGAVAIYALPLAGAISMAETQICVCNIISADLHNIHYFPIWILTVPSLWPKLSYDRQSPYFPPNNPLCL